MLFKMPTRFQFYGQFGQLIFEINVKLMELSFTVWNEIIFRNLNCYNSANMPGIDKILFGYCLGINS